MNINNFSFENLLKNKNAAILIVIIFFSLLMLFYIIFVNKQSSKIIKEFFNKEEQLPQKTYPALDMKLQEVMRSDNPQQTAENYDFDASKQDVKVVIILKDESFVFTPEYGKEYLRYGKYIQASVKYDMLEKLAANPKIASIASPLKGTISPK